MKLTLKKTHSRDTDFLDSTFEIENKYIKVELSEKISGKIKIKQIKRKPLADSSTIEPHPADVSISEEINRNIKPLVPNDYKLVKWNQFDRIRMIWLPVVLENGDNTFDTTF